jgi:hypothetical protein
LKTRAAGGSEKEAACICITVQKKKTEKVGSHHSIPKQVIWHIKAETRALPFRIDVFQKFGAKGHISSVTYITCLVPAGTIKSL